MLSRTFGMGCEGIEQSRRGRLKFPIPAQLYLLKPDALPPKISTEQTRRSALCHGVPKLAARQLVQYSSTQRMHPTQTPQLLCFRISGCRS